MKNRLATIGGAGAAVGSWAAVLASLTLLGCGGGDGATVLFQGTCLEPLYRCFATTGSGSCSYDRRIQQASLTFPNGAKITSVNMGTADNSCFGASGPPVCLQVTRGADGTNFQVRGKDPISQASISATVVDDRTGMLQVQCPGIDPMVVPKPASNPSFEDLSRCITQ